MKKKDLIVIIIFISFLFVPSISYWFLKDKMDNNNYENRTIFTKPELLFKNITNFPKDYENYYNDNLAFKNEIRKNRSKLFYNLFNISSSPRVIVGEDGWLFYNSRASEGTDSISDFQNKTIYIKEEKSNIKKSLLDTRYKLQEKNIDFYILIAPNKENVYSDILEKRIKKSNNKYSKTEDLINYLNKNPDLKILYPKDELVKGRKTTDTYYKYDTHWNSYGAYLGATKLLKTIDSNFKNPDIKISYEDHSGDLAVMNLSPKMQNKEPIVKNYYDDIDYKCNDDNSYCISKKPLYNKTILIVGDSFRVGMIPYIAKLYKKSLFIHRDVYKTDYLKKVNPDIVVFEMVERYSYNINNTDMLFK